MTDIAVYAGGQTIDAIPARKRVFIFGANELGKHGAGSARYARDHHGAVYGQGFGPQGDSFGIPTCSKPTSQPNFEISIDTLRFYIYCFILYAKMHPELDFQVTRIGTGFVGLTDAEVAPFFTEAPSNCFMDELWKPWLPNHRTWGTF